MAIKKWILFPLLLLIPAAALAGEEEQTYTIRKGDTLWGISERFISDPYYWPSLWSHNQFITNPHFIYPGQTVRIYDGRLEIVPDPQIAAAVPTIAAEPPAAEIVSRPMTLRVPGAVEGFISAEEFEAAGVIVDAVDNRIMLAAGDRVFAQMKDLSTVRPNDRFSLFRVGEEVRHPITRQRLGYRVTDLGTLAVREINAAVITGEITAAAREVERGARLRPWQPPINEVALKKAAVPLTGTLVAGGRGQIALGQHDLIYVDLGVADGLVPGNFLYISRPRKATDLSLKEDVQLPDVLLGAAVVLDVRAQTASALVIKSVGPLHRGDRVNTVVE